MTWKKTLAAAAVAVIGTVPAMMLWLISIDYIDSVLYITGHPSRNIPE